MLYTQGYCFFSNLKYDLGESSQGGDDFLVKVRRKDGLKYGGV